MTISLITPTADRPLAFALCEQYMARQTLGYDEWIVADGGQVPVVCTQPRQVHLTERRPPGVLSFCGNLLAALEVVTGDVIVCIEDDDWEAPTHLAQLTSQFAPASVLIAGDDQQRYYHVGHRCWRRFDNVGASLCQTAFRRELVPLVRAVIRSCLLRQSYGIDAALWAAVPDLQQRSLIRRDTVVGIK